MKTQVSNLRILKVVTTLSIILSCVLIYILLIESDSNNIFILFFYGIILLLVFGLSTAGVIVWFKIKEKFSSKAFKLFTLIINLSIVSIIILSFILQFIIC
ncbi:hypothetical protein ATE84_0533 [Aquimarina sp. MAR_2010_214]|nr:hypothetical protein ATE84_0533 [Aquimarina sp. MAR_2010_214]